MNRYEEFLSRLLKGEKILFDGGTGTEVERRGVPQLKNAWNAGGALTHPKVIKDIHLDFIKEGAEIVISNTFATCKHLMKDADCLDDFELVNRRSIELAVEARNVLKRDEVLVAGGISHWSFTNRLPTLSDLEEGASEQSIIMKEAGADLILLEMMIDIPRMLSVLKGVRNSNLPVWVGFSCEPDDKGVIRLLSGQKDLVDSSPNLRVGETLEEAILSLKDQNIPLINIMHTDVEYIDECLDIVKNNWNGLVGVYAHSGDDIQMEWTFDQVISPKDYLIYCERWLKKGVNIIGGCCGTGPEHIRYLKKNLSLN